MTKTKLVIYLIFIHSVGFSQLNSNNENQTIKTDTLTSKMNLDNYVNKLITIKGEISNTKIPQIIGIDVSCMESECRGEIGIATGILIKIVILEKDVDPYSANRGAGTYYRLKELNTEFETEVKILKN
jgi:hypothetical protein